MVTATQLPVNLVAQEKTAIRQLLEKTLELHGDEVQQVILFGSKARGDFSADSDTDLLMLVRNETWNLRLSIWSLAARIELEHDVIFNIQVIGLERWGQMCEAKFGLCQSVEREGLTLFKRSQ
ncbi:MAG: nucleotidyltransferase domain-containing protein [Chloroflexota bacterium]